MPKWLRINEHRSPCTKFKAWPNDWPFRQAPIAAEYLITPGSKHEVIISCLKPKATSHYWPFPQALMEAL